MIREKYDSTVARIAGNLLSGVFTWSDFKDIGTDGIQDRLAGLSEDAEEVVRGAVEVARALVAEIQEVGSGG